MTLIQCPTCATHLDVKLSVGVRPAPRLGPSPTLLRATKEVDDFLRGHTVVDRLGSVPAASAYEAYCRTTDSPVTAKAFGLGMRENGVGMRRDRSSRHYTGLRLR